MNHCQCLSLLCRWNTEADTSWPWSCKKRLAWVCHCRVSSQRRAVER